ncbi:hypothetical protein MBLNU457_5253t1 [Dothideomycetes sp. NU457]
MVTGFESFAGRHLRYPENEKPDPYQWDHLTGWRSYRALHPFRGMYWDVRRRAPWYLTDWADGLRYRTFAGTVRIFFVNLLPALAFILDMERRTNGYFGVNEALFSSALAAIVFSLTSAQPLTVVGITGLISLFNYTIYDIAVAQGIGNLYPQFLVWVSIWAAIFHWIFAICNLSDYMRYITDFSSNAFGMYVGIIYMEKGVQELIAQFPESTPAGGFLSIVVALCYWFTVYMLELMPNTTVFTPTIRKFLSDYAYPICTIWWTGFVYIPGTIRNANVPKLPISRAFHPTARTDWFIHFWNIPVKWVFVALPIGFLLTLLFYYDHNISSITAQARQFPLKKPAGFHWDFFLLGITCFVGGILGLPLPNGLVPQAPVHTDSLTNYKDKLIVTYERDDNTDEMTERHKKEIVAESVEEQRVSHFLMGLALVGMMTGPLLIVLHQIPRCLLCGVFFVVGWGSIEGNGMTLSAIYILTETRFMDPSHPMLKVRKWKVALFLLGQILGVGFSVAISQTIGAIGFPVIIIALIPLRWKIYPYFFTLEELQILDSPTANSDVVLASIGGAPEYPEVRRAREKGLLRNEGGEQGETGPKSEGPAPVSNQSSATGSEDGIDVSNERKEKKRD